MGNGNVHTVSVCEFKKEKEGWKEGRNKEYGLGKAFLFSSNIFLEPLV